MGQLRLLASTSLHSTDPVPTKMFVKGLVRLKTSFKLPAVELGSDLA
jgi:hypothetical protein